MSIDALRQRMNAKSNANAPAQVAPMVVLHNAKFSLTAGELREACKNCPDGNHPHVAVFRKAVAGLPDNQTVTVDRVDLEALLDDKDVEIVEKTDTSPNPEETGGEFIRIQTKRCVPRGEKGKPTRRGNPDQSFAATPPSPTKPKDEVPPTP
jgi:hypothetical protein